MINAAMLLGRVGKKDTKQLKNGGDLTVLSIATSKRYKDASGQAQEQTTWHNVSCFSKLSEIANKYVQDLLAGLVEGLLGGKVPVSASDQSLISYLQNRDYRDAVIARCVARQIMDNMTSNISNIINTRGRDGGTALVPNWINFSSSV